MPKALLDRLGETLRRQRLNLLVALLSHNLRRFLMNLGILDGFKTYIVAVAMVVAALSQLVGVDLPSFDGHSAGQLLMEGLAILFLRKGIKG